MGKFVGDLVVKKIGNHEWELFTPITYITDDGMEITVPAGTQTDFASVPRPFWSLFPPDGKYAGAAVVHDYLYRIYKYTNEISRKRCDQIFLEAMAALEVPYWKRKTMYRAVRLFGWIGWNKREKEKSNVLVGEAASGRTENEIGRNDITPDSGSAKNNNRKRKKKATKKQKQVNQRTKVN